jgi:hypothetical protein
MPRRCSFEEQPEHEQDAREQDSPVCDWYPWLGHHR